MKRGMTKVRKYYKAINKELDVKIKESYSQYLSDALMVKMKQEKLQLKDKIAKLKED